MAGVESVVMGCKCMGRCRDGLILHVVNQNAAAASDNALMMEKIVKGFLCALGKIGGCWS